MKRVLHLPLPVGGMPWALAQAERPVGLDSKVLYIDTNWFNYPYDICLNLNNSKNRLLKLFEVTSTFFKIRNNYDIYHFNFGRSLINIDKLGIYNADLSFYPENKKLFVTYNGCDARQKYPTMKRSEIAACHHSDCYGGMCNSGRLDRIRRLKIRKMAKHVRHIWAVNPDLLYFLPKEKSSFLPYAVTIENSTPVKNDFYKKQLIVVHAPTDRAVKGTEIIIAALERVKKKYPNHIQIRLIENMPHEKAIEMYKTADIVVDQLLVGWYGGLAIEVMNFGKPVICRIEKKDLKFLPKEMASDVLKSFINADPDQIEDVISNCIENRKILKIKSEAAIYYARKWHDPKYVAGITKEAYETL